MRGPKPAVGRQPLIEVGERLWADAVQPPLGVDAGLNQAGVLEDTQMLRDRRLAQAQLAHQIANRPLAVAKQVENRNPPWLGERLERSQFCHCSNMLLRLYACQVIYGQPACGAGACTARTWPVR